MATDQDREFDRLLDAMKKAAGTLNDAGIPFVLGGGLACWARGGPRTEHDVDLLVKPEDAERAQEALGRAGMRIERPPEGWLVKVWDDGILVDLIWAPMGLRVTHEVLRAARPVNVDGMPVPALAPTDVLTSKLLALNEGHLDFEGLLAMVRGVREQVDWDELRRRTEAQPLARSFLYLAGELGLTPEPEPEPARLAKGA